MTTVIALSNGLSVLAFIVLLILIVLVKREGRDERAQFMGYKLFSFLFVFLIAGLSLIIAVTGWQTIDYTLLRVCICSLFSASILVGCGYWIYLSKKV